MTGAINLLVSAIELYPKVWNQGATSDLSDTIVLVGPWEHHSNILPWRYFIDLPHDLNHLISDYHYDNLYFLCTIARTTYMIPFCFLLEIGTL